MAPPLAKSLLSQGLAGKDAVNAIHEEITARNVRTIVKLEQSTQRQRSASDRIADAISSFCGSMIFVWVHAIWFVLWILGNTGHLGIKPFDPYPFNFLTLVVSLEAIFLSTFILISGNRQSRIDERRSHLDLQINLLAEQESTKTLQLLEQIAEKLQIKPCYDPDDIVLSQATCPEALAAQIEAAEVELKETNCQRG